MDIWDDELVKEKGVKTLKDKYVGKKVMKVVKEKKYLGDIISYDNIKDKTDKALGNFDKSD